MENSAIAVSELVPRTFLWCCKFMREHALHPLAHHSRFVQLTGSLPTDPAQQKYESLCRAIEFGHTFDQLRRLSYMELLARRLQLLEISIAIKWRDLSFEGFNRGGQPHLSWHGTHPRPSHDRVGACGERFRCAGEGDNRYERTSKTS